MKIALFLDISGHNETLFSYWFQVSGPPLAWKAAGLIEKKRTSNIE